jgi:hypothetical protein
VPISLGGDTEGRDYTCQRRLYGLS